MSKAYNGNQVFNINCNLYPCEDIKPQETLEDIKTGMEQVFKDDLIKELEAIGLKFVRLECFSPKEYNFQGDSIDLVIEVTDLNKYIPALEKNKDGINKKLKANKSYDGYIAMTVDDIDEDIERASNRADFTPDVICLTYLLQQKIDFSDRIDVEDYFIFDDERDE